MRQDLRTKMMALTLATVMAATAFATVPTTTQAAKVKVTSIALKSKKATLFVGGKTTIKVAKVNGKAATKANKGVTYKSSNKKVATVSKKGAVKAIKKGTAVITVKSKYNSKATTKFKVTVKQQVKKITVTNSVSNTISVRKGKSLKIKTAITPTNASSKKLTFKSNSKKIVKVSSKGVLKGVKAGKTTVTIKSKDGKKSKKIKVIVPKVAVTKVSLSAKKTRIKAGETTQLTTTYAPSKATVKLAWYTSSDTKVATVSSKGLVKAVSPGVATITVKSLDGYKTATVKITVEGKKTASKETAYEYAYTLDNNAVSYDIKSNGITYNVSKKALIADIGTLAKSFGATTYDPVKAVEELSMDNLFKKYQIAAENKTVIGNIISITGEGATKNVTIKGTGKQTTYQITAQGKNISIQGGSKLDLTNINVKTTTDSYVMTMDATADKISRNEKLEVVIAKDYSSFKIYKVGSAEKTIILSVSTTEAGINISINKTYYNELANSYLGSVLFAGSLSEMEVYNVY